MPTKLKPSTKSYNRQTNQTTVKHYYIKTIAESELVALYNNTRTKPKLKQKIMNELTRRRQWLKQKR
jgi:hypothetical protein